MHRRRKRRVARRRLSLLRAIGYRDGRRAGYERGFLSGYDQAYRDHCRFEGTSIIIPTYNQRDYLQKCIESIQQYTTLPYEIIVIDNGSDDGTSDYLASIRNRIRYRIQETNEGFAGAVNEGLRLAMGSTLLFLNNDTLVTRGWLENLLACVMEDPKTGLAGPVTNYISGDQLIAVTYETVEQMHQFAEANNRQDPARRVPTTRLTGFCVLMRREFFERLGYMDEGFRFGNCEDDDYGIRARLLGCNLIISHDTFIHHFGSVSMRALGASFEEVYAANLAYFSEKWGDSNALIDMASTLWPHTQARMIDYYPSEALIQAGSSLYWVEAGQAHPIIGESSIPDPIRISMVDWSHWTAGAPIAAADVQSKFTLLGQQSSMSRQDGMLFSTSDGNVYRYERGMLRRFATPYVAQTWNSAHLPIHPIQQEELQRYPVGRPIIAPPILRSTLL
jgi:O-antigen biosynthesis protein